MFLALSPKTSRTRSATQASQFSCVAPLHPPSPSPSNLTLEILTLSHPVPGAGRPLILVPLVPPLPRVSMIRTIPSPPRTPRSWEALQELTPPPLPALRTSTRTALLEIWLRAPKLICPGQALFPRSGHHSFPPHLVPRQPSGHLQFNPSTAVVPPMHPRLRSVW